MQANVNVNANMLKAQSCLLSEKAAYHTFLPFWQKNTAFNIFIIKLLHRCQNAAGNRTLPVTYTIMQTITRLQFYPCCTLSESIPVSSFMFYIRPPVVSQLA